MHSLDWPVDSVPRPIVPPILLAARVCCVVNRKGDMKYSHKVWWGENEIGWYIYFSYCSIDNDWRCDADDPYAHGPKKTNEQYRLVT